MKWMETCIICLHVFEKEFIRNGLVDCYWLILCIFSLSLSQCFHSRKLETNYIYIYTYIYNIYIYLHSRHMSQKKNIVRVQPRSCCLTVSILCFPRNGVASSRHPVYYVVFDILQLLIFLFFYFFLYLLFFKNFAQIQ